MSASISTRHTNERPTRRRKCLLSLDGGGVRGLSSILILKDIMDGINHGKKDTEKLHPWQVFDLMGGTSTGGLIAVMLGRLRMSIEDCIRAYLELSKVIFQPIRHFLDPRAMTDKIAGAPRFDEKNLERAIEKILVEAGCSKNQTMLQERPSCPTFVTSVSSSNTCSVRLRSYESRYSPEPSFLGKYTILQACRATTAAKTYFDGATIGRHGQKFIDAGIVENNPIRSVYQEAKELWSKEGIQDVLLISIGTGSMPDPCWEGNIVKLISALQAAATERERTWRSFASEHKDLLKNGQLFRLDVEHGLAAVGLDEYKQQDKIAEATRAYLNDKATRQKTTFIVNQLRAAKQRGSLPLATTSNVSAPSLPARGNPKPASRRWF